MTTIDANAIKIMDTGFCQINPTWTSDVSKHPRGAEGAFLVNSIKYYMEAIHVESAVTIEDVIARCTVSYEDSIRGFAIQAPTDMIAHIMRNDPTLSFTCPDTNVQYKATFTAYKGKAISGKARNTTCNKFKVTVKAGSAESAISAENEKMIADAVRAFLGKHSCSLYDIRRSKKQGIIPMNYFYVDFDTNYEITQAMLEDGLKGIRLPETTNTLHVVWDAAIFEKYKELCKGCARNQYQCICVRP